jgi:hypothetical protein
VVKLADNLNFFDKMSNVFVTNSSFLEIPLHGNLLAEQLSQEDLSVSSFSNRLENLKFLSFDEKC